MPHATTHECALLLRFLYKEVQFQGVRSKSIARHLQDDEDLLEFNSCRKLLPDRGERARFWHIGIGEANRECRQSYRESHLYAKRHKSELSATRNKHRENEQRYRAQGDDQRL